MLPRLPVSGLPIEPQRAATGIAHQLIGEHDGPTTDDRAHGPTRQDLVVPRAPAGAGPLILVANAALEPEVDQDEVGITALGDTTLAPQAPDVGGSGAHELDDL